MRALTVQQPWASAIIHAGKTIENRTQLWAYRGPLAIHAGRLWSDRGENSTVLRDAFRALYPAWNGGKLPRWSFPMGVIIGVVDLVDVHRATDCCTPWGQYGISYAEPGQRRPRQVTHLVLENPRPLPEPIPCRGALGLWTPTVDVTKQLLAVTGG
ncbi:ASCH domain-containing protein [Mycolicibacterium canariasense]|uniref:ASCH domain-containing protein n=1 Tax=Mycolicibacterium canariasense TaxID=228230 RepID=UPI000A1474B8|nr:ASCH domain-containing protein [Mycolicibacterium canariasense]MCV7208358.1 hypothetical protein [Mycolicibacterium canariasense]ORV13546.1 hypothetical protein AWB94_04810 [Mycolicibacterium canariasense]